VPKYEAKASGGLSRVSTSDSQASAVGGGQFVKALFDFNAENEHEISFKKDDKIEVLQILDENWIEGTVNNKVCCWFPGQADLYPSSRWSPP
jgi:hypothetical protein